MEFFYLFSFFPIILFSLVLWADVKTCDEYARRHPFLLRSIVFIGIACLAQLLFRVLPPVPAAGFEKFRILPATLFYILAFLSLEHSLHIQRIEDSYYAADFRTHGSVLKRLLLLGGALVVLTGLAVFTPIGSFAVPVTLFLYGAWCFTVTMYAMRVVFNLPEGIIRKKNYPFVSLLVFLAGPVLLHWFLGLVRDDEIFLYAPAFIVLNAVYLVRVYREYLFYRTRHLMKRITDRELQQDRWNGLLAEVIVARKEEDEAIIAETVRSALDEMKESVIVKDHTFTGAMIYRRVGEILRIDSAAHMFGYCTPLAPAENVKRMNREQLQELTMNQVFDLQKISSPVRNGRLSFGEELVQEMLETRGPVRVDPIPACYRGLHELIYLVPVFNHDRFDGFVALFKDSFSDILPEERRGLKTMIENLSVLLLVISGKDTQLERNRLQGEIEIARNIQTSILPRRIEIPGYRCAGSMLTASEVGGDVYDHLCSGDAHYIGIGDVAGHGLPAGIMALSQMSAFHGAVGAAETLGRELEVHQIYDIVNRVLCRLNRDRIGSDKFMTQNYFMVRDGSFVHAGTHLIALVYRRTSDRVEELEACVNRTGFLGLSEFITAKQSQDSFAMEPGDVLMLYTDGVIEAKNRDCTLYGLERLKKVMIRMKDGSPEELIEAVRADLAEFAKTGDLAKHGGSFADDVTLVVLRKE
jgi:sigma-B regulation protein RsbU (phosphoserine phosphatase)